MNDEKIPDAVKGRGDLLPCPFCGSTDVAPAYSLYTVAKIECRSCGGAAGRDKYGSDGHAAWNRRAPALPAPADPHPQRPQEEREVLKLLAREGENQLKLMAERDAAQATAERLRACLTEIATHDFYTMAGYPPAECLRDLARAALSSSSSAEAPRQHQEKDNA